MNPKAMYDVCEMLCAELGQYARKGGISRSDLEPIEHLTTSICNLKKITQMDENGYSYGESWASREPMYSGRRNSRDGGYSSNGGNYSSNGNGYSNEGYDAENRMRREMMMY